MCEREGPGGYRGVFSPHPVTFSVTHKSTPFYEPGRKPGWGSRGEGSLTTGDACFCFSYITDNLSKAQVQSHQVLAGRCLGC